MEQSIRIKYSFIATIVANAMVLLLVSVLIGFNMLEAEFSSIYKNSIIFITIVFFITFYLLAPVAKKYLPAFGWENDNTPKNINKYVMRQIFIVIIGLFVIACANALVFIM